MASDHSSSFSSGNTPPKNNTTIASDLSLESGIGGSGVHPLSSVVYSVDKQDSNNSRDNITSVFRLATILRIKNASTTTVVFLNIISSIGCNTIYGVCDMINTDIGTTCGDASGGGLAACATSGGSDTACVKKQMRMDDSVHGDELITGEVMDNTLLTQKLIIAWGDNGEAGDDEANMCDSKESVDKTSASMCTSK
eukprot:8965492-Ditylum_brightwellii.AAC.1